VAGMAERLVPLPTEAETSSPPRREKRRSFLGPCRFRFSAATERVHSKAWFPAVLSASIGASGDFRGGVRSIDENLPVVVHLIDDGSRTPDDGGEGVVGDVRLEVGGLGQQSIEPFEEGSSSRKPETFFVGCLRPGPGGSFPGLA